MDPNLKRRATKTPSSRHPAHVLNVLKTWFQDNIDYPYPDLGQKKLLVEQTGLCITQINNWFVNARRRSPLATITVPATEEPSTQAYQNASSPVHETDVQHSRPMVDYSHVYAMEKARNHLRVKQYFPSPAKPRQHQVHSTYYHSGYHPYNHYSPYALPSYFPGPPVAAEEHHPRLQSQSSYSSLCSSSSSQSQRSTSTAATSNILLSPPTPMSPLTPLPYSRPTSAVPTSPKGDASGEVTPVKKEPDLEGETGAPEGRVGEYNKDCGSGWGYTYDRQRRETVFQHEEHHEGGYYYGKPLLFPGPNQLQQGSAGERWSGYY